MLGRQAQGLLLGFSADHAVTVEADLPAMDDFGHRILLSPNLSVEAAPLSRGAEGRGGRETRADRRAQPLEVLDHRRQANGVGPPAEATAERWEACSQDQRQIDVARPVDHALLQAA